MARSPQTAKSCLPKLLPEVPDANWGVEDLNRYARAQSESIDAGDRALASNYWRLGLALSLVRRQFTHRQWGRNLESLGIDKTRAAKARAIHATFASLELVAGLTVQEAYGRRQRKTRVARRQAPAHSHNSGEFLQGVRAQADSLTEEVASVDPDRAAKLLAMVEETIAELEALRSLLRSRIET